MRERVAKLEVGQDAMRREMDQRFNSVDAVLKKIEEKLLTKWDVARVVGAVFAFAVLLLLFGPRLLSMLPT